MRTKLMMFLFVAVMPIALFASCSSGKKSNAKQPAEKEFYLSGLKYETRVKMSIEPDGKVSGTVTANEYFVDGETVSFSGTFTDGKIEATFDGEPPVVGAASSWTDKPWRIEAREGKEVLIIPFYAKSYETFEWRDSEYVFEAVEPQETESGDNLTLRTLRENETLCYEDESRRISSSWIDDTENFIVRVEAKQRGVKSFSVEGAIVFECVLADALVLSSGTSHVRKLQVYSLNTGNELFPIEGYFKGNVTPDKNQSGFTVCSYSKNAPTVEWSAEAGRWDEVNKVPAELFNADFEKTVQEVSPNLFNGMQLAALQKVHVNLKTKKINYLNEYKWSYIE